MEAEILVADVRTLRDQGGTPATSRATRRRRVHNLPRGDRRGRASRHGRRARISTTNSSAASTRTSTSQDRAAGTRADGDDTDPEEAGCARVRRPLAGRQRRAHHEVPPDELFEKLKPFKTASPRHPRGDAPAASSQRSVRPRPSSRSHAENLQRLPSARPRHLRELVRAVDVSTSPCAQPHLGAATLSRAPRRPDLEVWVGSDLLDPARRSSAR